MRVVDRAGEPVSLDVWGLGNGHGDWLGVFVAAQSVRLVVAADRVGSAAGVPGGGDRGSADAAGGAVPVSLLTALNQSPHYAGSFIKAAPF